MPVVAEHRGVPLFDFQTEERLERVKREIDWVYEMTDLDDLIAYLRDFYKPNEARGFAYARVEGAYQVRSSDHAHRADIDLRTLHASLSGWDSLVWNSCDRYITMLEARANAPGVRKTIEARPPELAERMRIAQEEARKVESTQL
jgi:hypothetical protein